MSSLLRRNIQSTLHGIALLPQFLLVGGGGLVGIYFTGWSFRQYYNSDKEPPAPFTSIEKDIPSSEELYKQQ